MGHHVQLSFASNRQQHENTMGVSANHDEIFHSSNEKVSIGGLKSRVLPSFLFYLDHYAHLGFQNNGNLCTLGQLWLFLLLEGQEQKHAWPA
jgi:hypothetical protein